MKFKTNKRNVSIPLNQVHPNFKNPRKGTYDKGEMEELKESLEAMGQLTSLKLDENGFILAGHRRHQAIKELGWDTVRCDILVGLSEFDKSAVMISDNATQKQFNAWEHRKAIADIYWNEFVEEYEFKNAQDKGYAEFSKKLGISKSQTRKIVESMATKNLTIARMLEKEKMSTTIYDEILNAPEKYREDLTKKAIELKRKKKFKSDMTIRDNLRMHKKHLIVKTQKDGLSAGFFQIIHNRLDSLGQVLTKPVLKKASINERIRLYDNIKKNIIPAWKELEKMKKDKFKKSIFEPQY